MIPRLKPYIGKEELLALIRRERDAVQQFEAAFAHTFESRYAIAYPYGRSAMWAFLKALGIENAEVIMPAYTCVVVAHATVLSDNIPRFVDVNLADYNMNLDQVEAAINERTRAIIATHLFGYPLDIDHLKALVRRAEARYGHKIWVIQDCAHSFGAHWGEKPVCSEDDLALYGLNISKMMTSIFGGMLTTNDDALAAKLRTWRDANFNLQGMARTLRRALYLLAVYPAFHESVYGLVHWLQEETPLLNRLAKAYHLDEKIHFPPDYLDQLIGLEARVGMQQLRKYPEIIRRHRENAHYYAENLPEIEGWVLPSLVDGATYSHYVIRVPDRMMALGALANHGVELGQIIEYSIPHMAAYTQYAAGQDFPNSLMCSQHTVNLPVHAHLQPDQREQICILLRREFQFKR